MSMRRHAHQHESETMIRVNPTDGVHTLHLTQRDIATLRAIAEATSLGVAALAAERVGVVLRDIIGDCGDENCEKCSLDGDDVHDARYTLFGE